MIKLTSDYTSGAIAVPTDLIDRYLKLAPSASFKVLLFILRNPSGDFDESTIAAGAGLALSDVSACLEFWQSKKVIEISGGVTESGIKEALGNAKTAQTNVTALPTPTKPTRAVSAAPFKKPTQRQIAARIEEEPSLKLIYTEAQSVLGTFGYDTQALLLMLYDHYGFPPEVILTLLQHQKSEGRASTAAIDNRAKDWSKRGIITLELVEKELLALEKIKSVYLELKAPTGYDAPEPTPKIASYIREWAVERKLSTELIIFALSESGNSFPEASKKLKKWSQSGITSPSEVKQKKAKAIPEDVKKTYDTANIGKNSILERAKLYAQERSDNS